MGKAEEGGGMGIEERMEKQEGEEGRREIGINNNLKYNLK